LDSLSRDLAGKFPGGRGQWKKIRLKNSKKDRNIAPLSLFQGVPTKKKTEK